MATLINRYRTPVPDNNISKESCNDLLERVIIALDRTNDETKQTVFNMSCAMSEPEIIRCFNQQAQDTFNILIGIATSMGKEKECNVAGYKALFDNAIKINAALPLDKFTLLILEFAPEIYAERDDVFLEMSIPETNIKVGNEFSLFRSEMFKELWKQMAQKNKDLLKGYIILLTIYAHAFLYKTVLCIKN